MPGVGFPEPYRKPTPGIGFSSGLSYRQEFSRERGDVVVDPAELIERGEEQVKTVFDGLPSDPTAKTRGFEDDGRDSEKPIIIVPEDLGME